MYDCKSCMTFFVTCPCGCGVSFCPDCFKTEEDDDNEEEEKDE